MSESPKTNLDIKKAFVQKRRHYFAEVQKFIETHGKGYGVAETAKLASDLNALLDMHTEIANAPLLYTLEQAAQVGFAISQQIGAQTGGLEVEISEDDAER